MITFLNPSIIFLGIPVLFFSQLVLAEQDTNIFISELRHDGKTYTRIIEPRFPGTVEDTPQIPILINHWSKIDGICKLFKIGEGKAIPYNYFEDMPDQLLHDFSQDPALYISEDGDIEKISKPNRERITEIICEGSQNIEEYTAIKKSIALVEKPTERISGLRLSLKKNKYESQLCPYLGYAFTLPHSVVFSDERILVAPIGQEGKIHPPEKDRFVEKVVCIQPLSVSPKSTDVQNAP